MQYDLFGKVEHLKRPQRRRFGPKTSKDTAVYVVTDYGVVEADEYVFRSMRRNGRFVAQTFTGHGLPAGNVTVDVSKASGQLEGHRPLALKWAVPRVDPNDLLMFMDFNVWHRRSVIVKSLLVAGLGWHLEIDGDVVLDPGKGIDEKPDHPAVKLLKRPNPNRMETFDALVYRYLVDFYSMGNAYFEVVRNRKGKPGELYHAPARTMRRDASFNGYWQVRGNKKKHFRAFGDDAGTNEILHLYQYDPSNDYYGIPDWYASLAQMGLERTIVEFNTKIFSNSLMAHLAVIVEGGKLSQNGREALREFVREKATGVENAGRIILLEDERDRVKIRFEKLNLEVKDLMIVKALEHFRDVVVAAHGVPPRILGIVTPGQLGASGEIEGQLRTFRETVLRPGKRLLETVLGTLLEEIEPGARVRFAEMDVTDLKVDGEFYSKMVELGVYSVEEVKCILSGA